MIEQKFLTPSPRDGVKMKTQLHDDKIFRKNGEVLDLEKGEVEQTGGLEKEGSMSSFCTAFYTP